MRKNYMQPKAVYLDFATERIMDDVVNWSTEFGEDTMVEGEG